MTDSPSEQDAELRLAPRDRALLAQWAKSRTLAARLVLRSRIVLLLADGYGVLALARKLGVAPGTIRLWKQRFREGGPQILLRDAPGRGRKPVLDAVARQRLREDEGTGVSVEARARALGVSASTVRRWRRRVD